MTCKYISCGRFDTPNKKLIQIGQAYSDHETTTEIEMAGDLIKEQSKEWMDLRVTGIDDSCFLCVGVRRVITDNRWLMSLTGREQKRLEWRELLQRRCLLCQAGTQIETISQYNGRFREVRQRLNTKNIMIEINQRETLLSTISLLI